MVKVMLKAFKYRIYPTEQQKARLSVQFGGCRYIYNWGLEQKVKAYQQEANYLSYFDLANNLKTLKEEKEWLKEVYSQALQMQLRNLDGAFQRFFKEKKGFPKFKSRKNPHQSIQYPQGVTVKDKEHIYVPKIGKVKTVFHRELVGKIKTVTISCTPTGKYYVSFLVELSYTFPIKTLITDIETIGIDLGIKHFCTLSSGIKIDNPKYLLKAEKKLKRKQRVVSRRKKGGQNRKKAVKLLSVQYEKVINQRKDFLHKLTAQLIRENQTIALESLSITEMLKNHKLAKLISDCGWGTFTSMLNYKAQWYGRNILVIGRFEPSSRMCSHCGSINSELKLRERNWTCKTCSTKHDRDINAAINIKKFALHKCNKNTSGTEEIYA